MTECPVCGSSIIQKNVDVERWWQGRLVIIEGVPAHVCQQCGEMYFDADVVEEMEGIKQAATVKGERYIQVPVRPYRPARQAQ